jgi:Reverse transcriptase (RNA-dependent DNA polymerase)
LIPFLNSVLLDKLVAYSCPQVLINWLTNFLTGQYQSVVSLSGSSKLSISRSIIQGSGIGPPVFLAIIVDLHPKCMSTVFSKYADDLTVVIPGSAVSHADDEIDNIVRWSARNKLRLNMSKTKEIVLYKNGNKKLHCRLPSVTLNRLMLLNYLAFVLTVDYFSMAMLTMSYLL